MIKVCRVVLGLALAVLGCGMAHAQVGLYLQASGGTLQFQNTARVYGATFGVYNTKRLGWAAIGPDFRGAMLLGSGSQGAYSDDSLDMGLVGLRAAVVPQRLRFRPYVEPMIGLGYWRGGVGILRQDATHVMMQVAVGMDLRVYHRVSWRVAEFTYGRVSATPGFINPETLSSGIVLELP